MPRKKTEDPTLHLMQEAQVLMDLDAAAHNASPHNDFAELDRFAGAVTLDGSAGERVIATARAMKWRMENVRRLSQQDVYLFVDLFDMLPPHGTVFSTGPYVLYFTMPPDAYTDAVLEIGMKKSYASSVGICLSPNAITKPRLRERIGGSVAFIRAMDRWTLPDKIRIDGVTYDMREAYNDSLEATRRHEKKHAFDTVMVDYYAPDNMEGDLMLEEAAEAVAEGPGAHVDRRLLLHTNYYSEHGIPEGKIEDLAGKIFYESKARQEFIDYRQRAEDTLRDAYERANKRLIAFSLNLMDFRKVTKMVPEIAAAHRY